MARTNGPIQVWHRTDTIPSDAEGGYAGGDSTAAAITTVGAQAGRAVQTVENLNVTASSLPPGATATATLTGVLPHKFINIGIPRGEDGADGMGYAEGQQLLAQNQTTLDAAQSAQANADTAVTLAEQAQAAALEVPDANVSALVSNPTTDTRAALATVLPDKRVEVASMPAWTGNPADDQSAAFAQAAAVHTGPATIGVPVGTWKAQGLILREGLFYVGQGMDSTTLALPDSPTQHLMRTETVGGYLNSGGVIDMALLGKGSTYGDGADEGINGIDFSTFDAVEAFEIRHVRIQGFDRGVNGSQNGGIGNDRWLVLSDVRAWRCKVGIYANEHPMLFGVEVRECYHGITGRLYDLTLMAGCKINRCIVGIGGMADSRCTNINAHITGVSFYRCGVGVYLDEYASVRSSRFNGTHPVDPKPGGELCRGIVVRARAHHVDIMGNRFGSEAYQFDVDIDFEAASVRRHHNVVSNHFVAGAGTHPTHQIGCIRAAGGIWAITVRGNTFELKGKARGIHVHGGSPFGDWHIVDNDFRLMLDGQVLSAESQPLLLAFEDNRVTLTSGSGSPAYTRPLVDLPLTSTVGVDTFRGNTVQTTSTPVTFLNVDARSAIIRDNVLSPTVTLATWVNSSGVDTVRHLRDNVGGIGGKTFVAASTTIPNGQNSVVVDHGLVKMPLSVVATPIGDGRVWVTSRTSTQFTLVREGTSGSLIVAYQAYAFNQ